MLDQRPEGASLLAPHRVRVHGHVRVLAALAHDLAAGREAQSYLLSGPPGVGKRTVARHFAQALLCTSGDLSARPCGACRACRMVHEGTFGDLLVLTPPLRIEAVRDLQHVLALAPGEATRRVAILPEVETASAGAANSLLKTLEEPPSHAVLVLTTGAANRVPATVRSRCRSVALRALSDRTVVEALCADWGVAPEPAALLAGLAAGRLGWAARALADDGTLATRTAWLDALVDVLDADRARRLVGAGKLGADAGAASACLSAWRGWWRDVLLLAHGLDAPVVNRDRLDELAVAARRYGVGDIVRVLRSLDDALARLAANANARLTVEVLVLGLP
jgi:DNA polymerase III subunit delta'